MKVTVMVLGVALALLAAPVGAQLRGGVSQGEPSPALRGGVSRSDEASGPLCAEVFKGQDPLTERPEIMPMAIGGGAPPRCLPPNADWRVVGQDRGQCCFVMRIGPIRGRVVNIDDVRRVEQGGGSCGVDPFDPKAAVCTGGPSSPAPDETSPPPGGKGLYNSPLPGPPRGGRPAPTPSDPTLLQTMERCLSAKLSYYRGPTVEASASVRPVSVQGSTLTYSPAALDRQPLQARVFALAAAIADHAQALHDAQFGGGPDAEDPTGERDQIVGYLDRCLVADGVLPMATNNSPDDPRALYSKALGGLPSDSPRIDAFAYGYTSWPLAPAPLLPKSY